MNRRSTPSTFGEPGEIVTADAPALVYGRIAMRIAITGAKGFIGRAAISRLRADGHTTVAASRSAEPGEIEWSVAAGFVPPDALSGFDAVVHLAGENIAGARWTEAQKQRIAGSRTDGTRRVVEAIARAEPRPRVLVSASGIAYYGRTTELVDERSPAGAGFLADVTQAWEREATHAESLGVRVVKLRFGVVLGPGGGAFERLRPVFALGLGARIGRGDQWMPWIHLDDAVSVIAYALASSDVTGAYNVVAPTLVTNAEFTQAFARAVHRPAFLSIPSFALRLGLGELAQTLLEGQRAAPWRLQEANFPFRFPDLDTALTDAIAQEH